MMTDFPHGVERPVATTGTLYSGLRTVPGRQPARATGRAENA